MHQEAEKLIGRQAQEVGEVRKLADELLKQQLYKKDEPALVENEIDFFEDPKKAVRDAVDKHPDVLAAKQAANQMKQMQTQAMLQKKHPDFAEVIQDGEFINWVKEATCVCRCIHKLMLLMTLKLLMNFFPHSNRFVV